MYFAPTRGLTKQHICFKRLKDEIRIHSTIDSSSTLLERKGAQQNFMAEWYLFDERKTDTN